MSPILRLPSELHLHICSFIIPENPLTVPPKEYSGLLFTCKALRDELEPEICKRIASAIHDLAARIRNEGDDINYTPPTTLHGWRNLTVSRPMSPYMFAKKDPFLGFKYFYFDTFTVTVDFAAERKPFPPHLVPLAAVSLAIEISALDLNHRYPSMKRWRLDWRALPQKTLGSAVEIALYGGPSGDRWEVENMVDEEDAVTGVCFYKRPKRPKGTMSWMWKEEMEMSGLETELVEDRLDR